MELIAGRLTFYQATWMKRPKKINPDVFRFVHNAVAPDNLNPKEMQYLRLWAGSKPDAATDYSFKLHSMPVLKAGMARLVLPLDAMLEGPESLIALTQELVADLRFCWGSSG